MAKSDSLEPKKILEGAAEIGLKTIGKIASSQWAQTTGAADLLKNILYHGTRAVVGTGTELAKGVKDIQSLAPLLKLEKRASSKPLFDLTFTDEQNMIAEMLESFSLEVLRPMGKEADEKGAGSLKKFESSIVEMGITGITIPEAAGGAASERSPLTVALIAEKLGYGDYALGLKILSSLSFTNLINDYGSDDQRKVFLPEFVKDKYVQGTLAVMEPGMRFDISKTKAKAQRGHSGYWITGEKSLVIAGKEADFILVFAKLEGAGVVPFLLTKDTPGLSWKEERYMGLRAANPMKLILNNVHVPSSALLGENDKAFKLDDFISSSKIALAALTTGTLKATIDYTIEYANTRMAFGEPITNRQAVAFMLADMATEYEALRLLMYRAASRAEMGMDYKREAYLADIYSAKYSMSIGTDAVQLLGGHGYTREHPNEMWYRHLRASAILSGAITI